MEARADRDVGGEGELARLRDSELRFRSLVEASPDALVITDASGRIVLVSSRVEELFGYGPEELMGQPVEWLLPQHLRLGHVAHRARYMDAPQRRPMGTGLDLWARHKDGHEFPVEISLSPLPTTRGVEVLAAIRDISQRRQLENKLRALAETLEQRVAERSEQLAETTAELLRANGELTRTNTELERFAGVVSHDLKEPLRMVTGYLRLLATRCEGRLGEEADQFLGFALEGARRMQELIEALLGYARLGSRGRPFAPTHLAEALAMARQNLVPLVEAAGAEIDAGPLPVVDGDLIQLVQLFQNLVSNAIKFRGAEPPRIAIAARRDGDEWVVTVRDNGIGIPPAARERVFDIFQRLHTREEYPGTGIGLAICRRVVERHGGRIWVEPGGDAGSTFVFTLPAGDGGSDP